MDSRLIYSIVNSGALNIDWRVKSENEWFYIGIGNTLKKELILEIIDEVYGKNENLILVIDRVSSKIITNNEIEMEVLNRIGEVAFKVCDTNFINFLEFAKSDVMRVGRKS